MKKFKYLLVIGALLLTACEKQTDNLEVDAVGLYYPLEVGQVFNYKLDSIVFINFGQQRAVKSYDARDRVLQQSIDNNDTTYYISREIKETTASSWTPNISYTVTKSKNQIEVLEENLRYIKLVNPVKEYFQWPGNSYLPYRPLRSIYEFSNDEDMQYWNYEYTEIKKPEVVLGIDFSNVVSVLQVADSINVPITIPNGIAYKNHWEEKYALGIGLIEKKVEIWEYQPPIGSLQSYRSGFGIHLQLVSIDN